MKISADRADSFCARPDAKIRSILIYGPDDGLVRERVTTVMKTVLTDLSDPFRVADLAAAAIAKDAALLADEAAAMALTGGRRVIRIRDATDSLAKPFEAFLASPVGDALIVVQGDDLSAKSALRKLFEANPLAAAVPCYADDEGALASVISRSLNAAGLTAAKETLDYLVANLGGDRAVTRQELDKLITYMGSSSGAPRPVSLDDAMACIGDMSALAQDDLILAAADGDSMTAQRLLDRLFAEGTNPIPILRAALRHFQRLHLAGSALSHGHSQDSALGLLKPPVFFKTKSRFIAQLRLWSPPRAMTALDLLLQTEIDCKTTGMPEQELTSRAFLSIANAARAAKRGP